MPRKPLSAPYLYQRGRLFGFRWTCSPRLAEQIGRNELRRSLGTGYLAVAVRRAIEIAAKISVLETKLDSCDMRELKRTDLLTVLNHYFHTALADTERWRTESDGLTPADVEAELIALEFMARDTRERLSLHRSDEPHDNLKVVAGDAGFEVPVPDSAMAKELARGILRTDARLIEIEMRRTRGDYTDDTSLMQPLAATPAYAGAGSRRLSEVIRLFSEENKGEWNHRTGIDNKAIFRDLIEILGDPPIGLLSKDALIDYSEKTKKLPPNHNKTPRFKDLSIADLLKLPELPPSAPHTVNKRFVRVQQLFAWASMKGYIPDGVCPKLTIRETHKTKRKVLRDIFDADDLKAIFLCDEFASDRIGTQRRTPYMYWVPLLALFAGARLEEIMSLRTKDIVMVGDVLCLDINRELDKRELGQAMTDRRGNLVVQEKQLKNDDSVRICAIHPTVIDLGFVEYVEYRRRRKDIRLFPETKVRAGTERHGTTASNWFGRYLDRRGITSRKKVFHSFRHTFINALKQNGVDLELARELAGHQGASITYALYGKDLMPGVQREILKRLDFWGIDFSPLAGKWKAMLSDYGKCDLRR
ncbi:MAG: site-specific integrase [Betaproteobacteria bacterium]|nr:site-specific integrase [Betaproteobacteria bacterium]